jgi:tetratricopeptide (TPR) repeat protein
LAESVGRRAIVTDGQGGTPPLEVTSDGSGSSSDSRSAVIAAAVGPPLPSRQSSPRARAHESQGRAYSDRGEFREAYAELEQAFVLEQDPAFVYELGECARSLGNRDDAVAFYRDYLRRAPDGPFSASAKSRVSEVKAEAPGGTTTPGTSP